MTEHTAAQVILEIDNMQEEVMLFRMQDNLDDFILTFHSFGVGVDLPKEVLRPMLDEVDPDGHMTWVEINQRYKWFVWNFNDFLNKHENKEYRQMTLAKVTPRMARGGKGCYRFIDPAARAELVKRHQATNHYYGLKTRCKYLDEEYRVLTTIKGLSEDHEAAENMRSLRDQFSQQAELYRPLLGRPVARKLKPVK